MFNDKKNNPEKPVEKPHLSLFPENSIKPSLSEQHETILTNLTHRLQRHRRPAAESENSELSFPPPPPPLDSAQNINKPKTETTISTPAAIVPPADTGKQRKKKKKQVHLNLTTDSTVSNVQTHELTNKTPQESSTAASSTDLSPRDKSVVIKPTQDPVPDIHKHRSKARKHYKVD